jgi:FixJ family two-component response regulator
MHGMGNYDYSTIIVSNDAASLEDVVNVASALGESVAVVDTEDSFRALYSRQVRCVVLETYLPQSCCLGIIRHLGHNKYRGSLVFSAGPKTVLNTHTIARRLAAGYGIAVIDTLVKPIQPEQLLETLINATDPGVVKRLRADLMDGPQDHGYTGSC